MGLSDYNPLEYFKELTVFPRTVFLVGFIVFLVGITHGVYNKTAFAGLTIIASGLSFHYFSTCRWQEPYEPYRMHFDGWAVTRGIALLIVTAGFAFWAYRIPVPQEKASTLESQPKEIKDSPPQPQVTTCGPKPSVRNTNSPAHKTDDALQQSSKPVKPPIVPAITQGSGSIAQVGGTGNSATVINTKPAMPHASWQSIQNSGNSIKLRISVDKAYPGAMFAVVCDRPCEATAAEIDWGKNRPNFAFGPEVRYGHPNNPDPVLDIAAFKVDFPAVLTPEYAVLATVKSADGSPLVVRKVDTLTLTGR